MSRPRTQTGYVFEANNSWHLRYYLYSEKGKRIQKSHKICDKGESTPSKDSLRVQELVMNFMRGVNDAVASERSGNGHCCAFYGERCRRTVEGKFVKRATAAPRGEVNA